MIKIERPGRGDDSRAFGPPWLKDASGKDTSESAYFTSRPTAARNRSPSTSRRSPRARRSCASSPSDADVLIENYKVGDLARYGLGYDDPESAQPAADLLLGHRLRPDRALSRPPGLRLHDPGHGRDHEHHRRARRPARRRAAARRHPDRRHHAPACTRRSRSARRSHTATRRGAGPAPRPGAARHPGRACSPTRASITSRPARRPGASATRIPNIVPYQPFKTKDGDVILACGNDNLFSKFCEVAGCRSSRKDPRFATNAQARGEPRRDHCRCSPRSSKTQDARRMVRRARGGRRAERADQQSLSRCSRSRRSWRAA